MSPPPPLFPPSMKCFFCRCRYFFWHVEIHTTLPPPAFPTSIHLQPSSAKLSIKMLSFENHLLLFETVAKIENIEMQLLFVFPQYSLFLTQCGSRSRAAILLFSAALHLTAISFPQVWGEFPLYHLQGIMTFDGL